MKIIRKTVWQMTADGFHKLYEDAYEHAGSLSEAKSAGDLIEPGIGSGRGVFDTGGPLNQALDPLDLFGGKESAAAGDAARSLPGQLSALVNTQAQTQRYNTAGPFGSSSWSVDPKTGRYTQNVSLAPSEQRQFDTSNQIAEQMLGKAQEYAPSTGGSFSYDRATPGIATQQFSKTQSLAAPVQAKAQGDWQAKMANAGIAPDSAAYQETQAQRIKDSMGATSNARALATTQSPQLAQQQRQQRMAEMAQLLGGEQLNLPTTGGTGVDVAGATAAANAQGIQNANQSAAQRNANMNALASTIKLAYPNG